MGNFSNKIKKSDYVQTRISPEIKENTDNILRKLGISPSQAINMFYHQIYIQNGIPFDLSLRDYMTANEESEVESARKEIKKGKYKIYDPDNFKSLNDILK